jgi:DNA-directed RNA polymerase subunit beta'
MKHTETHPTYQPDTMTISLASPERIRAWSYGEIAKPETINYRTGRSERGGLFDEKIFGPEKDYECYCGKYKRIRYAGIVCEKCGVEVTKSIVRRERMGHIELASPVAHIWLLRGLPSRMSLLLDVTVSSLEKVIYFAGYIITNVHEDERARVLRELEHEYKTRHKILEKEEDRDALKEKYTATKKEITELRPHKVLSELDYHTFARKYSTLFDAGIGAEAVCDIFKTLDLDAMAKGIEAELAKSEGVSKPKMEKRLQLIRSLKASNQRPEWMFLSALPVIPPALRPMVGLEGGRYATSDVNDLYRRVINRNNRLKKLMEIGAPDVILRNEKRILQEAVDALIDNSARKQSGSVAMNAAQRRQLKSLSDNIKSKQGIFRQNLLGKRVDYSGRSVIVVGPNLKLNQCGIPKFMALELFRPFVMGEIIKRDLAHNIRGAGKLIEDATPEVWEILEEVIKGKYVLLNRAPTLHRLSILAFHPVLIEGKAIQIHPLVTSGFNADFDGDQMAVHVPLSVEAQREAGELIASNKNLLKPQTGDPVTVPTQDIVLGCFWMTRQIDGKPGEGRAFASPQEAILAHDFGHVDLRSKIFVLGSRENPRYAQFEGRAFETTAGRLLFNSILPADFGYINSEVKKKDLADIIDRLINRYGVDATAPILDDIKAFGYKYVTASGSTFGIDDAIIPPSKPVIMKEAKDAQAVITGQYEDGLVSNEERYRKVIEIWEHASASVSKAIEKTIGDSESIHNMVVSGARGSVGQLNQTAGMKGLIINNQGRIIEYPITSSYKEGLTPIEYFITNHGSRKGLTDTALNTAKAGYLTRRLVVVAQDVVITEEDCGTKKGFRVREEVVNGMLRNIGKQVFGRVLAEPIKDADGNVMFKRGAMISRDDSKAIEKAGVKEAIVRSPLTCDTLHGLCRQCYGLDLGRNHLVKYGEAVGIVAAQAIGEPGTQLTLRTIHAGGVAGSDITMGLPRVEELLECRGVKIPATIATVAGSVTAIKQDGDTTIIEVMPDGIVTAGKTVAEEYVIDPRRTVTVKVGDKVTIGDTLTDGSVDLQELFSVAGFDRTQAYVIEEVSKVYELHSAPISRKHLEIIVRQMFSRRQVASPGDTRFTTGEVIENIELVEESNKAVAAGGLPAKGTVLLKGIQDVSLTTKSWLSAASFQYTTRTLVSSAILGKTDELRGLMENVIIGNLIPAGTGLDSEFVSDLHPEPTAETEDAD